MEFLARGHSPITFSSFLQEQTTESMPDQNRVLHGLTSATHDGRIFVIFGSKAGALPGEF